MNKIDDGGPAFPHVREYAAKNIYRDITTGGMSLRDYFAGQALAGIVHAERMMGAYRYNDEYPDLARLAYGVADAMLKARKTDEE